MISITDVISYGVAIIGCLIGIFGYLSSINARANKDGQLLERLEQVCRSVDELKIEVKENNKGVDRVLDNHTERIIKLEDGLKELRKKMEGSQ